MIVAFKIKLKYFIIYYRQTDGQTKKNQPNIEIISIALY